MRMFGKPSLPPVMAHRLSQFLDQAAALNIFPLGRESSVRKSMMSWLGLMWLLTLIVSVTIAFTVMHSLENTLWTSRLSEELTNSSRSMTDFVARGQMLMHVLGAVDKTALAAQPALLDEVLNSESSLLELVKIDRDGKVLYAASRDRAILSDMFTLPQAQWFRAALEGIDYYSDVQYSFQDTPYLILTVKARDGGVIAARLEMDVLQEVVGALDIGNSGQVYVADETGSIMAHGEDDLIAENVRNIPAFDALLGSTATDWKGEYNNLQDEPMLGAAAKLPATGWILVVEVLQDEAYLYSRIAGFAAMATIMTMAGIVMYGNAHFLKNLIFRPMVHLRDGAVRLSAGDYGFRLRYRRHDEVGEVTEAFNTLAAALQKRDEDLRHKNEALSAEVAEHERTQATLEELNTTLEQRVTDRTQRLETVASELQRSNRALEEFAYVASHDLQEPLRKVRTFGDRLQSRYGHVLDTTGQDYLARMQNGSTRMQTLIDDLLAYSRVTTKAQPLEPVDLNLLIAEVLSDLDVTIESLHAEITVGPLPTLNADATQLRQLLQNLVGNALKFHKPGTIPHISITNNCCPDGCAAHPYCEITVADDGIGFDMQYAERIFQVFQRLHGRSEYEGTGVGLAICRKIVERHGGTIRAESTPNVGSRFICCIPCDGAFAQEKQALV